MQPAIHILLSLLDNWRSASMCHFTEHCVHLIVNLFYKKDITCQFRFNLLNVTQFFNISYLKRYFINNNNYNRYTDN